MFRISTWLQRPVPLTANELFSGVLEPDLWHMTETERRYLREARADARRPQTIILFQPTLLNLLDA
ncbi:hypothetical protein HJG54_19650 [Leptolyngbya sp. NK1-12]|uniref:Uncharacterized protein n=1 Tax=Leptolyngbya sp. NK1-12 TaxID=2547451 RepID=A0AA97AR79_9CYAN|nr:hypothetical protein [Leptolyngbya sp. NK1-12]WNZ24843.1 hypothetical protein HJG54_19650 [Leptolyngbya sp. NK1-12]